VGLGRSRRARQGQSDLKSPERLSPKARDPRPPINIPGCISSAVQRRKRAWLSVSAAAARRVNIGGGKARNAA
jgi:hypothetical protein